MSSDEFDDDARNTEDTYHQENGIFYLSPKFAEFLKSDSNVVWSEREVILRLQFFF